MLGLPSEGTTHKTPLTLVSKEVWESYYSFMVVRHPFDRLLSSYFYHTKEQYDGFYTIRFPDIKEWSLETYFTILIHCKGRYYNAIRPQIDYIVREDSSKRVDFVVKYEALEDDLKAVMAILGINKEIPHLNSSKRDLSKFIWDKEFLRDFLQEIIDFYKYDFIMFNYKLDVNDIIERYLT